LVDVFGIGKDHVATEHRNGQATYVVRLAQQHLAGPFTVRVAVGVAVVNRAGGADKRMSASSVKADGSIWSPTRTVDRWVNGFSLVVSARRISSAVPSTLGPNSWP
jgi:hypothetical protein